MRRDHRIAGFGCMVLAVVLGLVLWYDESLGPVNRLLMILGAMSFMLAGIQLAWGVTGRWSNVLASLACAAFAVMGLVVAVWGGSLEGGIPFVSSGSNQLLGHVLFGFGALLSGLGAVYFAVRAVRG
jgi:hypothetical protein